MKKNQKKIQVILLTIGFFLILLTYFYYPYITSKNKTVVEKDIQESSPADSTLEDKDSTSFENIEYQGYMQKNSFVVRSEKAKIEDEDPDLVSMFGMNVILYLKDREITITSDTGTFNKSSYDLKFVSNVVATDGSIKILSDNLELLANESSSLNIYNNVNINYPPGSMLRADAINYNFETKFLRVTSLENKRIKMKVFK